MEIHHVQTNELAKQAGEAVNAKLRLYTKTPKLLLLSGGSSLSILPFIDISLINSSCTISMSDERYSKDPKINNFTILIQTEFYKNAKDVGAKFIDTSIKDNISIEELAEKFQAQIIECKNKGYAIIATMGMGPDGHLSGMMPTPENPEEFERLFESKNLVTAYDAKNKNEYPLRITITMTLVLQINHAIMYVQGENKREALERVFDEDGSVAEIPARIWLQMNDAEIFTDIELE